VASPLHLVKVPLRPERLVAIARLRGFPVREVDEGYLAHVVLRELWQEAAPMPFVLRGSGRCVDAWGYSRWDAARLLDHAASFGDPSLVAAVAEISAIASRPMPTFEAGRSLRFEVRACPVVRLASGRSGHRRGAEIDAFLARCFAVGDDPVSREDVYRDWFMRNLAPSTKSGVTVARVEVRGISRVRLVRRTHGESRRSSRIDRPDVRFAGEVVVTDGSRLLEYIAHGVGRHRAFGFGALMLVAPGMDSSAT
jgi:CRISPR system Cascade subunit CasE